MALVALPACSAAADPVTDGCSSQLVTLAPKLEQSGYVVTWEQEAEAPRFLRAAHIEPAGRIHIEYRCGPDGMGVSVINHGLPDIPFHVLLAAGPNAKHSQAMPEWLRKRHEAVTR